MKKRLNKALAALLALVMVVALVPGTAFATPGDVTDLSSNIQIDKSTGKVTCSGTSGTSQKAIITSTNVSEAFGTKQPSTWDSAALDEDTLKSDLSISDVSTDLTAVQLTTANNSSYIVVMDLNGESKVVGAGYKEITGLEQSQKPTISISTVTAKVGNTEAEIAVTETYSSPTVKAYQNETGEETFSAVQSISYDANKFTVTFSPEISSPQTFWIGVSEADKLPSERTQVTVNNYVAPTVTLTAEPSSVKMGAIPGSIKLSVQSGEANFASTSANTNFSIEDGSQKGTLNITAATATGSDKDATLTITGEPSGVGSFTIKVKKEAFDPVAFADVTVQITVEAKEKAQLSTKEGEISITGANGASGAPQVGDKLSVTGLDAVGNVTYSWNGKGSPTNEKDYTVVDSDVGSTLTVTITAAGDNDDYTGNVTKETSQVVAKPVETVAPTSLTISPSSINTDASNQTFTIDIDKGKYASNVEGVVTIEGGDVSGVNIGTITRTSDTQLTVTTTGSPDKAGSLTFKVAAAAFEGGQPDSGLTVSVTVSEPEAKTPVITANPTTITTGADSVTIDLTATVGTFKGSLQPSNFTVEPNTTSLSLTSVSGEGTKVTLTFEGTAVKGSMTIKAKADAFNEGTTGESNTVIITVSDPAPTTPTTPSTTVDQPATDADSGTTTVDVTTNSTTSGTTASATVPSTSMNNAVNSAVNAAESAGTAPVVEVEVKTSSKADGFKVTLPTGALDKLAAKEDAELIITSEVAEVALDSAAIGAVAEQAGSTAVLTVTPSKTLNDVQAEAVGEAPVYDLTLTSNGEAITEFDGGVLTITIPYALPESHDPATVEVSYLDDAGVLTPCFTVYDAETGKVMFQTTHLSKYVITSEEPEEPHVCPAEKFTDVDQTQWYHESVDYAIANGLMKGVDDTIFRPLANITRVEILAILAREAGVDTEGADPWFQPALDWALENEVSDGTALDREITRVELVTMLYRYAKATAADAALDGFVDVDDVPEWGVEAMAWAVANGLIEGRAESEGTALAPMGSATRAEAAKIMMAFCELA